MDSLLDERFSKLAAVIDGKIVDADLVNEWFRLTDRECEILAWLNQVTKEVKKSESTDEKRKESELNEIQRLLKIIEERIYE